MEIAKGTKFIDTFERSQTFGKVGIVLDVDGDGDYWCFFIDSAKGDSLTDEEYDILDELGIDEFGTMGYAFKQWMKLV